MSDPRLNLHIAFTDLPPLSKEDILKTFVNLIDNDTEFWLDTADYTHIPDGPGVMLIGHRLQVGIALEGQPAGLTVTQRRGAIGDDKATLHRDVDHLLESLTEQLPRLTANLDSIRHVRVLGLRKS